MPVQEFHPDLPLRQQWVQEGCAIPPPASYKAATLAAYSEWSGARVLVETGTFQGDTTDLLRPYFDLVYTIEGAPELFKAAQKRFAAAKNVKVLFGDSAKALPFVLTQLNQKAVFWLDAHWCGEQTFGTYLSSAVMAELEAIFAHKVQNHVILIDDARYFCGLFEYPSVDFLRRWVRDRRPDMVFDVAMDSIRIHSPAP